MLLDKPSYLNYLVVVAVVDNTVVDVIVVAVVAVAVVVVVVVGQFFEVDLAYAVVLVDIVFDFAYPITHPQIN